MAYSELLEDRISQILSQKSVRYETKKMMGGLAYMVDDKMCVGIVRENLMARIDPEFYEEALSLKGCTPMDFTKRPMKGFIFVLPDGIDMDVELEFWINKALEFNPKAKSSKKKAKK